MRHYINTKLYFWSLQVNKTDIFLSSQNDFLARKLPIHQRGLWHEVHQVCRMDGNFGKIHFQNHGRQSVHLSWVQTWKRQLLCKYLYTYSNKLKPFFLKGSIITYLNCFSNLPTYSTVLTYNVCILNTTFLL